MAKGLCAPDHHSVLFEQPWSCSLRTLVHCHALTFSTDVCIRLCVQTEFGEESHIAVMVRCPHTFDHVSDKTQELYTYLTALCLCRNTRSAKRDSDLTSCKRCPILHSIRNLSFPFCWRKIKNVLSVQSSPSADGFYTLPFLPHTSDLQ